MAVALFPIIAGIARSPPTNDRRRPPAAAQSAAQAGRAARAPHRSISHAHRLPQARAPQSERCHKPTSTQLLNRGAVSRDPVPRQRRQHHRRRPHQHRGAQHQEEMSLAYARGGAIEYTRANSADRSVPPAPRPKFGARARPSAVSGHHPGTTRMSPCGGECRVGGTLLRPGPNSPAIAGIARSPPTNDRRRPPAAAQSAAQAGRAARAPHRSISHAHRLPQARAPQSERCHKPTSTQLLNRGAVSRDPVPRQRRQHHRRRPHQHRGAQHQEEMSLAYARGGAIEYTRANSADRSVPPAPRPNSGREPDQAQSAATILGRHGCRRVAASVVLVARCCALARIRQRLPASPDRHQQTIDVGRPLPHRAPHRRVAQLAHPTGRSRMPIACHRLALRRASDATSLPQRSC